MYTPHLEILVRALMIEHHFDVIRKIVSNITENFDKNNNLVLICPSQRVDMIKLTTEGVMENLHAHHIYHGIIIIKPAHTVSMNSPITNNLSAILNSHKKLQQSFHGPSIESLRYNNSDSGKNVS